MVYMVHTGYTILDDMPDLLLSPTSMQEAADVPMEYPGVTVEVMYENLMSKFASKESLNVDKNCTLWNPIFKYAVDKQARRSHDSGVGHYSSIK